MKKKNGFEVVIVTLLTLVMALTTIAPATALAAPPPTSQTWTYNASQLQNKNLSPGTIYWDDDLVTGQLEVYGDGYNGDWYNPGGPGGPGGPGNPGPAGEPPYWNNGYNNGNGNYTVYLYEAWHISDMSDNSMSKKQIAKRQAQVAFVPVRSAAQNKGWWDCNWHFDVVKKNKVAASATVEYKSVRTGVNSKSVYIRQITKKKNGRWETRFFVGDRSYTASQITSVFN